MHQRLGLYRIHALKMVLAHLCQVSFLRIRFFPARRVGIEQHDVLPDSVHSRVHLTIGRGKNPLWILGELPGEKPQPRRVVARIYLVVRIHHCAPIRLVGAAHLLDPPAIPRIRLMNPARPWDSDPSAGSFISARPPSAPACNTSRTQVAVSLTVREAAARGLNQILGAGAEENRHRVTGGELSPGRAP